MASGRAAIMNCFIRLSLSFAGLNEAKQIPLQEDFQSLYYANVHHLYERHIVKHSANMFCPKKLSFCFFFTEHLLTFLDHQCFSKYILGND